MVQVNGNHRSGTLKQPARKVSLAVGIGIFLLPILFIWLLLRSGYSTRSRIVGCTWLGLCGMAMLASPLLPNSTIPDLKALATGGRAATPVTPPQATSLAQPAREKQIAQLHAQDASQPVAFTLGKTTAIYRMLRTPARLTNNTGADLRYAEIDCAFYDKAGGLLGNGMGNWVSVKKGQTVSGEVVAAGIDLAKVDHQDCTVQSARPKRPADAPRAPPARAADQSEP